MADFKVHLTSGIIVGTCVAIYVYASNILGIIQSYTVLIFGIIGGLLPDIDSNTGKPVRILFGVLSIVIGGILFVYLINVNILKSNIEYTICFFFTLLILVNYVFRFLFKKLTVHRGIMHSIPYMLICAGLSYILFVDYNRTLAIYAGFTIGASCLIHLLLDEIYSVGLIFGSLPSVKKSFGTALKLWSKNIIVSILMYVVLTYVLIVIYYKK
ncbi:MAG: hypothetical protein DRH24_05925 [Deltaproteobacteria bacterium]|nr:MAG: hypothetical protein DRH24_05925 [Deltaproteobacteria bacterium]